MHTKFPYNIIIEWNHENWWYNNILRTLWFNLNLTIKGFIAKPTNCKQVFDAPYDWMQYSINKAINRVWQKEMGGKWVITSRQNGSLLPGKWLITSRKMGNYFPENGSLLVENGSLLPGKLVITCRKMDHYFPENGSLLLGKCVITSRKMGHYFPE